MYVGGGFIVLTWRLQKISSSDFEHGSVLRTRKLVLLPSGSGTVSYVSIVVVVIMLLICGN